MTQESMQDCCRIADHYGPGKQFLQAIQELAELIQAITRYDGSLLQHNAMQTEIADVQIMLTQLQHLLDIPDHTLAHEIRKKINRQLDRIQRETGQ